MKLVGLVGFADAPDRGAGLCERPGVERLELEDGRTGQVIEVLPNGSGFLVRVQIGTGPASIFVSDEELRRIAVRRIKK